MNNVELEGVEKTHGGKSLMKTIIVYATKHGATREIAERIARGINGAVTHDLKQGAAPDLAAFDCVIVGASIYAGTVRKEAKTFIAQNATALSGKTLGLFLSGMGTGDGKTYFEKNFPEDVLKNVKATGFLGGAFDPAKGNVIERIIMKLVTKQSGPVNRIDDAKIEQFVKALL